MTFRRFTFWFDRSRKEFYFIKSVCRVTARLFLIQCSHQRKVHCLIALPQLILLKIIQQPRYFAHFCKAAKFTKSCWSFKRFFSSLCFVSNNEMIVTTRSASLGFYGSRCLDFVNTSIDKNLKLVIHLSAVNSLFHNLPLASPWSPSPSPGFSWPRRILLTALHCSLVRRGELSFCLSLYEATISNKYACGWRSGNFMVYQ